VGKVKKSGAVRKAKKRTAAKAKTRRSGVTNVTRGRKAAPPKPEVSVRIRELDPVQKCGPGTSVGRLFRVDESNGGVVTAHLVFFDRHGWYCEHGRDCPAVKHARMHVR